MRTIWMAVLVRLRIAGIGVCETNLLVLDLIDPKIKRPEIPGLFFLKKRIYFALWPHGIVGNNRFFLTVYRLKNNAPYVTMAADKLNYIRCTN